MDTVIREDAGDAGIREVRVWDPLVRLIHWSLVAAVLLNGFVADPEAKLHEYIGYAALALVSLRLVWGLVGTRNARFTAFPPNPLAALRHIGEALSHSGKIHLSHNPLGALMVYNIWATMLVICASGIMMGTVLYFGVEWVEELHEIAFDWLIVSVLLHVAGVAMDTWLSGVPLVGAMITGRKRIPADREVA
jgi:cytochrome b